MSSKNRHDTRTTLVLNIVTELVVYVAVYVVYVVVYVSVYVVVEPWNMLLLCEETLCPQQITQQQKLIFLSIQALFIVINRAH
jgi:nitrate/nitrite-specific signal transduction histidine kinase